MWLPNWTATLYRANVTVGSVAQAQTVISTPSEQTSVTTATESVLNFLDTGPAGHFANPSPFPGMTIGEGLSNYVLQAKGTIVVSSSQAGYYTFGVSSDDGFTMTITGVSFSNGVNTTTCSGGTMAESNDRSLRPTAWRRRTWLRATTRSRWSITRMEVGAELELFAAKESGTAGVHLLRRELASRG